jgi:precorrin-6B methylase 1
VTRTKSFERWDTSTCRVVVLVRGDPNYRGSSRV